VCGVCEGEGECRCVRKKRSAGVWCVRRGVRVCGVCEGEGECRCVREKGNAGV
jgi:hypothetical protein